MAVARYYSSIGVTQRVKDMIAFDEKRCISLSIFQGQEYACRKVSVCDESWIMEGLCLPL